MKDLSLVLKAVRTVPGPYRILDTAERGAMTSKRRTRKPTGTRLGSEVLCRGRIVGEDRDHVFSRLGTRAGLR